MATPSLRWAPLAMLALGCGLVQVAAGVIVDLAGVCFAPQALGVVRAESATEPRGVFDEFMEFNRLVRNADLRPTWSAADDSFWFTENGVLHRIDPRVNTSVIDHDVPPAGPALERNRVPSPDGKRFLELRNGNLFLGESDGGRPEALTSDGTPYDFWAPAKSAWSPDGSRIVFRHFDSRNVPRIPLVDFTQALETVEWFRYPKAGEARRSMELHLYDVPTKVRTKLDLGDRDQYLFGLGWLPDGTEYLFLTVSRNAKVMELRAVRPAGGGIRTLITEERETFVAGTDFISAGWAKQLTILPEGRRLLWLSDRDGWKRLYLHDYEGRLVCPLTTGELCVDEVSAVDEKNGWVYFAAFGGTGLNDRHLYRVGLDGRGQQRLTEASGTHTVQFSPSRAYYIDTHSGIDRPPVSELHQADGPMLRVVSRADVSAVRDLRRVPPESFVVKAADGRTDLYGVLYKPRDFVPARKYPVINFIYQGPFMTSAPSSYLFGPGPALFAQAMAQLGFITFVVDGRALPNRSREFQDASYGRIGQIEIPDQVAALRQIAAARPYMDLSRVGIYGHSWGGYFALRGILTAPDVFSVAVASAPGELTEAQEVNEPYMDLPQNNKEGYAAGLNAAQAGSLRGKLLLIHGTHDTNAPLSTTLRMVDALVKAGKLHDLAIIPKADHALVWAPAYRKYYWDLVTRYFIEHLKP